MLSQQSDLISHGVATPPHSCSYDCNVSFIEFPKHLNSSARDPSRPTLTGSKLNMLVETKVKYRVTQKKLEAWLKENVGSDGAGKPLWAYRV